MRFSCTASLEGSREAWLPPDPNRSAGPQRREACTAPIPWTPDFADRIFAASAQILHCPISRSSAGIPPYWSNRNSKSRRARWRQTNKPPPAGPRLIERSHAAYSAFPNVRRLWVRQGYRNGLFQLVFLKFSIKRSTPDSKQMRRKRAVAAGVMERVQNRPALQLGDGNHAR